MNEFVFPLLGRWAQSKRQGEELGHMKGARGKVAAPLGQKEPVEMVHVSD